MKLSEGNYGRKNVKKSLKHFILGKSLSLIVGFGFFLILARALDIKEFGFYIILVALLEIMGLLSNFGCYFIAQRYIPELMHKKAYSELKKLLLFLFVFRVITLIGICLFVFFLSNSILNYFNVPQYLWIFQLYLWVVFFESLNRFVEMIFDSLLLQGYSQISILFRNTLRFIVVLYLYLYSVEGIIDLELLVFIEMVTGVLGIIIVSFLLMRFVSSLPKLEHASTVELDYIRYFNYARPGYIAQIIGLTYSMHTLKFVVVKLFGVTEAALFGFTSTLISMLTRYMPSILLVGMIRPLFVTAYNEGGDYSRLHRLTHIVIKINLLVMLPLIIFLSVLSEEVVLMLAGDKFENGGTYLFLFSVFMLIQIYHVILSQLNMAHEGGKTLLKATLFSAFGVVLGFMLLSVLEEYAILLGLILSEIIFCGVLFQSLSKHRIINLASFHGGKAFLLASVLSFMVLNIVHYFWSSNGFLYLFLQFCFVFCTFVLSLYFIKPFTCNERKLINKVLPVPYFCF